MHTKKIKSVLISLLCTFTISAGIAVAGFVNNNKNLAHATQLDTQISAYMFDGGLTLDGKLSENAWFIDSKLSEVSGEDAPNATVGFLWDTQKLYVGVLQSGAETFTITLNDKQAVYDVTSKTFTTNELSATVGKNGSTLEFAIPFADAGITVDSFGKVLPINIVAENSTGRATFANQISVELNGGIVYAADSCESFVSKGYTEIKSGKVNSVQQGEGSYILKTAETESTIGFRKIPDFISGNLDYVFNLKINKLPMVTDRFAQRGLCVNLWGYLEEMGFSLTKGADGKIYVNMLYDRYAGGGGYGWDGTSRQMPTDLREGDTAEVHIVYIGEDTSAGTAYADVIINGQYVGTFANLNCENPQWKQQFDVYLSNANSPLGECEVELLDFVILKTDYNNSINVMESLFNEKLPFEVFGNSNTKETRVMSNLTLPTTVKLPVFDTDVAVQWTSSNPSALSNTGVVNATATAQKVKLTASINLNGKKFAHTYSIIVSGFDANGKVMFLEDDLNPYTGKLLEKGNTDVITFDKGLNSIGYDQGSVKEFNEILLKETDMLSRIEKEDLSLYVSDDNVNYTRVKDWAFFRTELGIYITNVNQTARYVKLHCHLENDEMAAFTAPQQTMMTVYKNETLVGANGGTFTKLCAIVSEQAQESDTDVVTYVSLDKIRENLLDCSSAYADVRFVSNGKILPHYYDGNGFYIRIFETVEGQTVAIDVYGANDSAVSISNQEGVFDAIYGNKTIYHLEFDRFKHNIAVATAPNGDLLAIANWMSARENLLLIRSTDGGRTWSDSYTEILDMTNPVNHGRNEGGGFLLDPDANNGNGRLFYYYYMVVSGQTTYAHIIYTDDNGYTWSDPYVVNQTTSGKSWHASSYADGLKLSWADGDGPDVDYIFPAGSQVLGTHSFVCTAVYSKDNGKTWLISDSLIGYERGDEGYESGNSESAIAELPDGTLRTVMRCQYKGVYWYSTSYSTDHGVTWLEDSYLTNIAAPNTMPVLKNEPDGNVTLMWGGNNFMGGSSYRRYPMSLAYSDDGMQTWKQKLNLFTNTSMERYGDEAFGPDGTLIVQPSITFSDYQGSDTAYVSWWNFWYGDRGILIDDYHDMLYKTKGAADQFEITNSRYEGWYGVWGNASITQDVAKDGHGSLRIDDLTTDIKSRANRSVPAATKGTMSFDISFEKLESGFSFELKSAYVDNSDFGNIISAKILPSGIVQDVDCETGRATNLGSIDIHKEWINVTVNFDLASEFAEIIIDGVKIGDLSVFVSYENGDSITNVQLCDTGWAKNQMIAYVDNFVFYNGIGLMEGNANNWEVIA